jgi:hypothetical protein
MFRLNVFFQDFASEFGPYEEFCTGIAVFQDVPGVRQGYRM